VSRFDPDPDLARRFAALRQQERQRVPPFRLQWAAAGNRRPGSAGRILRLAAAGAAVVVVALLSAWLVAQKVPAPSPSPGAVPSIVEWRSPTDFLLRTPGQEILRQPPALGRGFAIEPGASLPSLTTDRRSS
jgi:hypothetical protein